MSAAPPSLDSRRWTALRRELLQRAQGWIPEWQPSDPTVDFGRALLHIAARLEAEVTQRLDQVALKSYRGFLSWLGVRGLAPRAARVPVAFGMTPGSASIVADPPVQMQASTAAGPVVFETQSSFTLCATNLVALIGADPAADRYFRPPPGVLSLTAPPALPNQWSLQTPAAPNATQLQLDPPLGLDVGTVLENPQSGSQYRVTAGTGGLVTIDPSLGAAGLVQEAQLVRSVIFDPFGGKAINLQQHALYLGADKTFDVTTAVGLQVSGQGTLPMDAAWSYWGTAPNKAPSWIPMTPVADGTNLFLFKPAGAFEKLQIAGVTTRWIKVVPGSGSLTPNTSVSALQLTIGCAPSAGWPTDIQNALAKDTTPIKLQGIAGTAPLVLDQPFYPLGNEPRLFDAFYLGCAEAFSKAGAKVTIHFGLGTALSGPAAALTFALERLVLGIGLDRKLHRFSVTPGAAGGLADPSSPPAATAARCRSTRRYGPARHSSVARVTSAPPPQMKSGAGNAAIPPRTVPGRRWAHCLHRQVRRPVAHRRTPNYRCKPCSLPRV